MSLERLDHGPQETPSNTDSPETDVSVELVGDLPNDFIASDAPDNTDLSAVADRLAKTLPKNPAQIDPVTLEAPFTPITTPVEKKRGWVRPVAIGLPPLLAAVAYIGWNASQGDDDPTVLPQNPAATAGRTPGQTPGPTTSPEATATSAPSPSRTEVVSPSVAQNELFKGLSVESIVSAEQLQKLVISDAELEMLERQYPDLADTLGSQDNIARQNLNPEAIVANQEAVQAVIDAQFTVVENGQIVWKPFTEIAQESGAQYPGIVTRNDLLKDPNSVASSLYMAAQASQQIHPVLKYHEDAVKELRAQNPSATTPETPPNHLIPIFALEGGFALPAQSSERVSALNENPGILPAFSDPKLVGVDTYTYISTDQSVPVDILTADLLTEVVATNGNVEAKVQKVAFIPYGEVLQNEVSPNGITTTLRDLSIENPSGIIGVAQVSTRTVDAAR